MRKSLYVLAIIVVLLIVALNKIDNEVIPYYAMVHLTEVKDSPAILALGETGKMFGVSELFVGWKGLCSLWPLFVPFMVVGSIFGFFAGLQMTRLKKDKEIRELKASIPLLGMASLKMAFEKNALDDKEEALRYETCRLEVAWEKLNQQKQLVDRDWEQKEKLVRELEEARNQLVGLKRDLANRLDKNSRLEKTIEKLEVRIMDLEMEVVQHKKENLKLSKVNLLIARDNNDKKTLVESTATV